ncbi:Diacylglycerol kinase, catalytic domain protein [Metarhizium album ARSEF 1941]|uniref:Diacylglycerol kinase, catalytic domain protein n=1 Tax=Metarhizium album (strain ARSEF 1941) TaxID=1081103 RepID=A0A0B2WVF8_METAS|nr:Diacylglycerol kinase, catalytic domain protein [Metarhizium album ARSEF 1941]KHN98058.1 Diacylglycerol kinase, catalytic domain protein [Metarhizium album ARSEF 1941]
MPVHAEHLTVPAKPVQVRSLQVTDASFSWTDSDKAEARASTHQVLFTADSSSADGAKYIICILREDPGTPPSRPFRLDLLQTDEIPAELRNGHVISGMPPHLQPRPDNKVDVIVSTKSGTGRAQSFWQTVLQPLLQIASCQTPPEQYGLVVTQDAQSVRQYAKVIGDSPVARTIILLSGDGGVVDLLNGHERAPSAPLPLIALLPLGTGNALFHSLHKPCLNDTSTTGPTPLVLALRTLFLGVAANLPVFQATFTPGSQIVTYASPSPIDNSQASQLPHRQQVSSLYGAIVASHGFHASIVYESDTPSHRVHGAKRFGMVAQELLGLSHAYKARLDVRPPGPASLGELERDAHETHGYILVSMVSNLERKFTISPASKPLDGKLHLVHFGAVSGHRAMEVMMKAYDGGKHVGVKWDDGERVRYEEVGEVRVASDEDDERWRVFCVDGTIVQVERGGGMSVTRADRELLQVLVDERIRRP